MEKYFNLISTELTQGKLTAEEIPGCSLCATKMATSLSQHLSQRNIHSVNFYYFHFDSEITGTLHIKYGNTGSHISTSHKTLYGHSLMCSFFAKG